MKRTHYERAKALIDALNAEGCGWVVHGVWVVSLIAQANAWDEEEHAYAGYGEGI